MRLKIYYIGFNAYGKQIQLRVDEIGEGQKTREILYSFLVILGWDETPGNKIERVES